MQPAGSRRSPTGTTSGSRDDVERGLRVAGGQPEQLRLGATTKGAGVDVPENWRSRTVLSVPVAGRLLDLSRQGAYNAVARGDLPALRIGRKLVVPVAKLRRILGELQPQDATV